MFLRRGWWFRSPESAGRGVGVFSIRLFTVSLLLEQQSGCRHSSSRSGHLLQQHLCVFAPNRAGPSAVRAPSHQFGPSGLWGRDGVGFPMRSIFLFFAIFLALVVTPSGRCAGGAVRRVPRRLLGRRAQQTKVQAVEVFFRKSSRGRGAASSFAFRAASCCAAAFSSITA